MPTLAAMRQAISANSAALGSSGDVVGLRRMSTSCLGRPLHRLCGSMSYEPGMRTVLLALLLGACKKPESSPEPPAVREVGDPARGWEILTEGASVGSGGKICNRSQTR